MQDKRRYHRMNIAVPMSFRVPPDESRALTTTLDISGLGISFSTDKELKTRQELLLYLLLPGEERVEVHAKVVRAERVSASRFKVSVKILDPIKFDEKKFVKFYAAKLKNISWVNDNCEGAMAKVIVIYYSKTGNTAKMAEFVAQGVRQSQAAVTVAVKDVKDVKAQELLEYDGIIIGSPTYYGSMAYEIKRLLDESVAFHGDLEGKVGGAFSSAANIGGGNETTILDILNAMLIHGMVIQGAYQGDHYGPVSIGAPDSRVEGQCKALGLRVAVLAQKLRG